jgi:hypothetical protein
MRSRTCVRWMCVLTVMLAAGSMTCSPLTDVEAQGGTYYVSSSGGNDDNDGLSEGAAFRTIAKVDSLDLQPGGSVLFKCGDAWRAEQLVIRWSGTAADPIRFGSYPDGCANKPVLSGSQAISGWALHAGSVYVADLGAGDNAGKFTLGINQLFRDGQRLTMGRWPNLDAGDGGYSFIDSHSTGGYQVVDNELPSSVDWSGAIMHLKNIRWSMIDRQVTGSSGTTLTLNQGVSCLISGWGYCVGWGYFLNNHLAALDQDGEWYYDGSSGRVYLYSSGGVPSNVEGSVILDDSSSAPWHGGVMLSHTPPSSYVIVEDLEIANWFNHGISALSSMRGDIYHHITVRNCTVRDVDAAGVRLSTWVWSADNDRDGLRGGHHMTFRDNVIDGANHFGVTGYFRESTFEDNEIKDIALVENLNASAMGCGLTRDECTENGDGFRIRTYDVLDSGFGNTLRHNRFERIGYNAVDVFGPQTTLERNFISEACYTKADCGGIRTFGSDNLASTKVHDLRILDNIIVDIPGNVDGCHASRPAFGMGLYVDHYSRDVEVRGNTVVSTTITGILYQRSTGQIVDNTVYNASTGTAYSAQISLGGSETQVSMSGNVMYGLTGNAWTLYAYSTGNIAASDYNYFFHPYEEDQIAHGPSWTRYTFAEWKAYSGQESHSKTNWFALNDGDPPLSSAFYNDTKSPKTIDLGTRKYLDLDRNEVTGSLVLPPFASEVLVDNGEAGLTLRHMAPVMFGVDEAADFTLSVTGSGFTGSSVVRWNGADRPTGFVASYALTATIYAADVSAVADVSVTVFDPSPAPTGTETLPLTFRVVHSVSRRYLPLVVRQ